MPRIGVKGTPVPLKFKLETLSEVIEGEESVKFPEDEDNADDRAMIAERIGLLRRWKKELEETVPDGPSKGIIQWRSDILAEQIDLLRLILKHEKSLPDTERTAIEGNIETLKRWRAELRADRTEIR